MEKALRQGSSQKNKTFTYMIFSAVLIAVLVLLMILFSRHYGERPAAEQIVIAIPYSEWVQDYRTNYYTDWLEKKTGYELSFVYLDEGYERESLNMILTSENSNVDAVFLPSDQEILSAEDYQRYIEEGCLLAPQDHLDEQSRLWGIQEAYQEADFEKLLGEDGRFYCFPSMNMARTSQNQQILWINIDWLTNLNLTMPQTTEEFREVLEAFRTGDPNGNGIADELPLVSCEGKHFFKSYLYLLNAFTYYDENELSWYVKDGRVIFGVEQEEFRKGIAYCADLYRQGLLVGDSFPYTAKQYRELINDPADTIGAFASHSIADVIYTNNPGVLSHFVQLAPLSSEVLEKGYAVRADIQPAIGGLIPANAVHKEAAARIMDVMLDQEAARIALYGEEGVDWRFSKDGELSTYGTRARVTTIRYLKGERQNQNYAGMGPLLAAAEYTDGVTWNGDHSMTEYIDARAVKTYEAYYPPFSAEDRKLLEEAAHRMEPDRRKAVSRYLEEELPRFIQGERKVESDADWGRFLAEYRRLAGK